MCACVLLARTLTERGTTASCWAMAAIIMMLLTLHLVVVTAASISSRSSHAAVSKYTTPEDFAHLRWDAITCLHQYINGLVVNSMGEVAAQDARSWPMAELVTHAHGNGSAILVSLHATSKRDMAELLAPPVNEAKLKSAAAAAAAMMVSGGYDGISLDFEGLKPESKPGLEAFVAACTAATHSAAPSAHLSTTVYAPKLLAVGLQGAYNISRLSELADSIFIMGYDMTWKSAHPGAGKYEGGPNSPLDGLSLAVSNAIRWGAPPSSLILGLPMYGKLFTCDGTGQPPQGNCSCAEKNAAAKSVDILAAAASSTSCVKGFDRNAASPFFNCAGGAGISPSPPGVRQQGWYEDVESFSAKLDLARSQSLRGIALWTAGGVRSDTSLAGKQIWDAIASYARGEIKAETGQAVSDDPVPSSDEADARVTSNKMPIYMLDEAESRRRGAVCLDGTTPAMYYRNASNDRAATSWVIYFKGGGWCGLPEAGSGAKSPGLPGGGFDDCAHRAATILGGSSHLPSEFGYDGGPIDPDPRSNPAFADFHHVVAWYCDGASFTGDRDAPLTWPNPWTSGRENVTLYFRGRRVLDFMLDTLITKFGLSNAQEVLISGGSAGGLASFVHADHIAARLPSSVRRIGAAPISGFFPLHASADGTHTFAARLRSACALHNCTAGVSRRCLASLPADQAQESWRCLAANYSYASSMVRFFPIQSVLDSVQLDAIWNDTSLYDNGCLARMQPQLASCTSAQVKGLNAYAADVLSDFGRIPKAGRDGEGGFIHSCLEHVAAQGVAAYTGYQLRNTTLVNALSQWWVAGDQEPASKHWYKVASAPLADPASGQPIQRCKACAAAPPAATNLSLITDRLTFAVDTKTGSILSLRDALSGAEFVAASPTSPIPLFHLELSDGRGISALEFKSISAFAIGTVERSSITITFAHHPALMAFSCVARFSIHRADHTIRSRLRCSTATGTATTAAPTIRVASFPEFLQPPNMGRGDALVAPWYEGVILNDPGLFSRSYNSTTEVEVNSGGEFVPWTQYPGFAAYQFIARYAASAGLYLATYDTEGHVKQFNFDAEANVYVRMPLRHLQPELPATTEMPFAPPYDVVLGTFRPASATRTPPPLASRVAPLGSDWGGWRAAADLYKDWSVEVRAPWTRQRLTERSDLPSWLINGTAGVIVNICGAPDICREVGYDVHSYGDNLESLAPMMARYKAEAGLRSVISVVYGWEHLGVWAGGGYFPPKPSGGAFLAAAAALRSQGDRAGLLISGYWFIRARNATRYGLPFDNSPAWEDVKDGLVVRSDGRTYASMLFPNTSTSGAHHGHSYRLCHAAPVANQTISRYFDQALNYAPMVSFDQEMGGAANFPCYNTSHGHPPGRGNWEWKGYKATLQSIQRRALQTGREVVLMQEQCSELAMPYLGAMWTRQFWQIASQGAGMQGPPSVNPNAIDAINVGVFSYLYHEYGLGMAAAQFQGQGVQGKPNVEPFQLRTLVIMSIVARGLMPAPFANDVNGSSPRDEWHQRVAAANAAANRAWTTWAPDVLAVGAAVMPPHVEQPVLYTYEVVEDTDGGESRRNLTLPAVQLGSFLLPEATVATVMLNAMWARSKVTVRLPWRRLSVGVRHIELRNGTNRTQMLHSWAIDETEVTFFLEPLASAMLLVPNVTLCGARPCLVTVTQ